MAEQSRREVKKRLGPSDAMATPGPYAVETSARFVVLTIMTSVLIAFTVGRAARMALFRSSITAVPPRKYHHAPDPNSLVPPPALLSATTKVLPPTIYTSKNYDTGLSSTAAEEILENSAPLSSDELKSDNLTCVQESSDSFSTECFMNDDHGDSDDEEHLPSGQHLLVDIKNVDGTFLNSPHRLARALVKIVDHSGLTLLSYHCHSFAEAPGVSCVGVLLESHIAFHTHPLAGSISIDLFTCGPQSLLNLVPRIEDIFAIRRMPSLDGEEPENPVMSWAFKRRGFADITGGGSFQTESELDINQYLLGVMEMDMKDEVLSLQTNFQLIQVFDVIEPRFRSLERYKKSLLMDGSYESEHPELFQPDRILYLDGVMQSRRFGESAYHEALVHPAMFAHSNPKRVAVIGGGEGATLREVLKHKTVEKAVMVEIDEMLVNVSKEYLPEWSDCSDLVGSSDWCVDDTRTEVHFEDALLWFVNRYGATNLTDAGPGRFDVIVMDALDPRVEVDFSDALYKDDLFLKSLYSALSDDGILVVQVGEAPYSHAPPEMYTREKNRAIMIKTLEGLGFESMHMYEESHGGFLGTWSYLVAFKRFETRTNWYANEAEVNLAIRNRLMTTRSGHLPLKYFDGASMASYTYPSRSAEEVFCRAEPKPSECLEGHGFDPELKNTPASEFEIAPSTLGEKVGRGLFTKTDIPEGSYIGLDAASQYLFVPPSTLAVLLELEDLEYRYNMDGLFHYVFGYGFSNQHLGSIQYVVDTSILTFGNHGCNGTYNTGPLSPVTEMNADVDHIPEDLNGKLHKNGSVFNPFIDRNHRRYSNTKPTARRDISKGEEIFDDYLRMIGTENDWGDDVRTLRAQCSGEAMGDVLQYEREGSIY